MHGGSGAGVSPAVAAPVAAPGWVVAVTVGLAVLLVVAAGWWIVRGVRGRGGADGGPDHDRRADAVCHLFMSLGMAGMFLAML